VLRAHRLRTHQLRTHQLRTQLLAAAGLTVVAAVADIKAAVVDTEATKSNHL
jgi:hypothetical protein